MRRINWKFLELIENLCQVARLCSYDGVSRHVSSSPTVVPRLFGSLRIRHGVVRYDSLESR